MSKSTSTPSPDFAVLFGRAPEASAEAPGRVNLIGEHTDYNGGLVLPMAIPHRTRCEVAASGGGLIRVWTDQPSPQRGEYQTRKEAPSGDWLDYIKGVTAVLRTDGFDLPGFDLRVQSEVPVGSGLSSSAALEVSLLRALRTRFGLPLSEVRIALLGQRVENTFVGANVGVMDQMAASLADERTALLIDTTTLRYERIPLPPGCELAVIDSGVKHAHAGGAYNERRRECEQAAQALGVERLAQTALGDARIEALSEPLRRRARHVVTENNRVKLAVRAMKSDDPPALGRLFFESHESLRRDFEVSCPELDMLVDRASADPDVLGARMTGGGFGGCCLVLARDGTAAAVARRLLESYGAAGKAGAVILPR